MAENPINWRGSSLKDIKNDEIFTSAAREKAGHQLSIVQVGLDPDNWKRFDIVGAGTKAIRIKLDDGWFRVMYVSKFPEAVYVLHCFRKKTSTTSKKDKDITAVRYKAVVKERSKKLLSKQHLRTSHRRPATCSLIWDFRPMKPRR